MAYTCNRQLQQIMVGDKTFMKQLRTKLLTKISKDGNIRQLKEFKQAVRHVQVIPQFSTEYKAAQVFDYFQTAADEHNGVMVPEAFVLSLFQLFSISTTATDLDIYNQSISTGSNLRTEEMTMRYRNMIGQELEDGKLTEEQALKIHEQRLKFLKSWVKQ